MKRLLLSVLIAASMLTACKGSKDVPEPDRTADIQDSQEPDHTADMDVSDETMEAEPVPAPDEEEAEPEENTDETEETAENADETEVPEIPESERGTHTYGTYVPQVAVFELSDGVLTVVSDTGYNWDAGEKFSISYPVAEDCVWETGYFSADFVAENTTDFESVKAYIEQEQAGYTVDPEAGEYVIDSPMGIYIEVTDGVVARVYTVFS